MNKLWQIFVAPGDESEDLAIEPSPWHEGNCVSIPSGHWELIIDYAKSVNTDYAQMLHSYSFATESNDENDYVYIDPDDLEKLIGFIADLMRNIQNSEPIHPSETEELPDVYENSEYVRMLEAISAVFQKALVSKESYSTWVE